jgi:hypothetical protein
VQFGFAAKQLRQNSALIFAVACCFKGAECSLAVEFLCLMVLNWLRPLPQDVHVRFFKTSQDWFFQLADGSEQPCIITP